MNSIITKIQDQIGIITINREKQLNALNSEVIREISETLDQWRDHQEVRVLVITGSGQKAFAAGADIKEFADYDVEQGTELSRRGQTTLFDKLEYYPKPIIAAINGYALGGGLELALACHLRISSHNGVFGLPEITLGLIPGYGGTQRLPHIIGKTKAYDMLFTGKPIDADTALSWGLISDIYNINELQEQAISRAQTIAQMSPLVTAKLIHCVNAAYYDSGREGFTEEIQNFGASFGTQDAKAGIQAFLNKEKPKFEGK